MATMRTFVKVFDNITDHPKWITLDPVHIGVWVLMLGYCRRQRTDGHFPVKAATKAGATPDDLEQLVAAGRFHAFGHDCGDCPQPADGDLYLHAYLEHQNSAADQEQLSAVRKAAGQKGGLAKAKQVAKQDGGNGLPEVERERETDSPALPRESEPDTFADWWTEYPRKVAKDAAAKAYAKALKAATAEQLLDGLRNAVQGWTAARTETRFIPHPATWLNRGSWADEVPMPGMPERDPSATLRPRVTVAVCEDGACPGVQHEWTDRQGRNAFVCMGVSA